MAVNKISYNKKTNNESKETQYSPDILKRLRSLIHVVETNVDTLRETASIPKVKRQILLNSYYSKNKSKPSKKRSKKQSKNNDSSSKSHTVRYAKYFSPKRSESVNRFNERIDPLVKIDTHIPYKSDKKRLFYSYNTIDEESILNNNYPHRFNSPSHSSFSRQQKLFSSQGLKAESSLQSSYIQKKKSFSTLQQNKHMKNSKPLSNNSKFVSLDYRNRTPDRPYQRYSHLTVSQLD